METPTIISIFFALCGVGILLSLAAPPSRQGNVLAWLGCLASVALILAGASALLAGNTFSQPLWTLPGLAATLTLKMDSLSAVFIFITPSPRHADVLLVVGPVTDHMKFALKKVYDAMPTPKRVMAVGACALSGGVFAESFVCAKGVADVLPVDVEVPGNPAPPLAILHGLLIAVGRKAPAAWAIGNSAVKV